MKGHTKWERIQDEQITESKKDANSVFSVRSEAAKIVGEHINKRIIGGKCLDIGCGVGMPYYMKVARKVYWTGVDPYKGKPKSYNFYHTYGEFLPFRGRWFDGVLFATSLDHIVGVRIAVNEARRVLKKGGLAFVWQAIYDNDEKPLQKEIYKGKHLSCFTTGKIKDIFRAFELVEIIDIIKQQKLYIFRK